MQPDGLVQVLVYVSGLLIAVAVGARWLQSTRLRRLGWRAEVEAESDRIRAAPVRSSVLVWSMCGAVLLAFAWWIVSGARYTGDLAWMALAAGSVVAGLGACAMGAVLILRAHTVGRPTLLCSRVPFVPGQMLEGSIDIRRSAAIERGVQITLLCEFLVSDGDSVSTYLLWGDTTAVPPGSIKRLSETTLRIPVSFPLPDDVRPTGSDGGDIRWIVVLRAGSGLMKLTTRFAVPVGEAKRVAESSRNPAVVERIINVSDPGAGEIVFDTVKARSKLRVDAGKLFLPGRTGQEIKATSIRAIDVFPELHDDDELCWNVRVHTIGGKTFIVAPHVNTKLGAHRIAQQLEDILTGVDRRQLNDLFADESRKSEVS